MHAFVLEFNECGLSFHNIAEKTGRKNDFFFFIIRIPMERSRVGKKVVLTREINDSKGDKER